MASVAGVFATTCCRCVPRLLGSRCAFPDAKKDDEYSEEAERLFGNVIDSDEEQADALSPEQIRRYLDASHPRPGASATYRSAASGGSSGGPSRGGAGGGGGGGGGSPRRAGGEARGAAAPAEGCSAGAGAGGGGGGAARMFPASTLMLESEYDDLFDEELEDEPANVIVGDRLTPQPSLQPSFAASRSAAASGAAPTVIGAPSPSREHYNMVCDADDLLDAHREVDRDALDEWLGITSADLECSAVPMDFSAAPVGVRFGSSGGSTIAGASGGTGDEPWTGTEPEDEAFAPALPDDEAFLLGSPCLAASSVLAPPAAGAVPLPAADLGAPEKGEEATGHARQEMHKQEWDERHGIPFANVTNDASLASLEDTAQLGDHSGWPCHPGADAGALLGDGHSDIEVLGTTVAAAAVWGEDPQVDDLDFSDSGSGTGGKGCRMLGESGPRAVAPAG